MKGNRYVMVAALLLVALVIAANATAFVYRQLTGEVNVYPRNPDNARGILCTGFYSSFDQRGIDLPRAGTNFNAPTYVGQGIQVEPGVIACRWYVNDVQYGLYESIRASFSIAVGRWYIQDFYGFGYKQRHDDDPEYVYVSLRVADALNEPGIVVAKLFVYRVYGRNVEQVASLDLRTQSGFTYPIELPANGAFRLSLYIEADAPVQRADFKIDFAVAPWYEDHD